MKFGENLSICSYIERKLNYDRCTDGRKNERTECQTTKSYIAPLFPKWGYNKNLLVYKRLNFFANMSLNAIHNNKILANISGFTVVLSFNFQHGCHTLLCPFGIAARYGSCIDIAIEIQGQAVSIIYIIILLPYISILSRASTSPYESFMSSLCLAF